MAVLQVDGYFTLVEAALKGFVKWRRYHGKDEVSWPPLSLSRGPKADLGWAQKAADVDGILASWCDKLLQLNFDVSGHSSKIGRAHV